MADPYPGQGFRADKQLNNDEKISIGDSTVPVAKGRLEKAGFQKNSGAFNEPSLESDPFEEDQFKTIRARLLFPPTEAPIRSVCVTSPSFGEGKTYICSRLGLSMAQNVDDKHVVLVDADIRRASLHRFLGFSEESPGLSDYLLGHCELSSVLLKPFNPNLLLIPGGNRPANPSELLSSKKMLDLLEELYARYEDRFLLVDLPSPNLVPEAGVIARKMDGIILVARAGKTPSDQVAQMIDWIGRERVIGVVLNRFDTSFHSSLYRIYRRFIRRK
jgi:capsular exopolysaccharide synthesis family protein